MAKSKKPSPVDIMNLIGDAADKKARMHVNPSDEEDSLNSEAPKAQGKKSPASQRAKQTAAVKAKEKTVGAKIPNKNVG